MDATTIISPGLDHFCPFSAIEQCIHGNIYQNNCFDIFLNHEKFIPSKLVISHILYNHSCYKFFRIKIFIVSHYFFITLKILIIFNILLSYFTPSQRENFSMKNQYLFMSFHIIVVTLIIYP